MQQTIKKVVIVGGGTSGWITAGVLAAEHLAKHQQGVQITLVESPNVATIGVGEGTWPTMRGTLKKMGISETEFFRHCDASFKQGAKFAKWVNGEDDDAYYHPLVLPQGYQEINLAPYWHQSYSHIPFADAVCGQGKLCDHHLAPKQASTPEYAHVANYAYHLDAGKFTEFLTQHVTTQLGVNHILDDLTEVLGYEDPNNKDIRAIRTKKHGDIEADLFIDCTGFKSLLLGQYLDVPFIDCKHVLFNDTALAVHVPYADEHAPIASHTISTAQKAGWIWDIGLPSRRGVGYVFSSAHSSNEEAEQTLRQYIHASRPDLAQQLNIRKIDIRPGHRAVFWKQNCVAVGLSAGFLEPLEASALVLIELAAEMISQQLPANRAVMDIVAKRYNDKFLYRWARIIDFLKLHYVLSKRRDSAYWIDNCRPETIPASLQELLTLWRHQSPYHADFTNTDEVFPSASYQYVLYGMQFEMQERTTLSRQMSEHDKAFALFQQNQQMTDKMLRALPSNRALIEQIKTRGLQKI